MSGRVLVVDDDRSVLTVLGGLLEQDGFEVERALSGQEAVEAVDAKGVDVVITDLRMPGMDGMTLLGRLRAAYPDLPVLMLTAHGSVPDAVEAMRRGAADFLMKPFDREEILFAVRKAMALVAHEARRPPRAPDDGERIIGESAAMDALRATLERIAPVDSTVLIQGETGTGKELVARALHREGRRAGGPFVAVNCAALPENLLESELFGHMQGAFTGATTTKPGRVALAEGGTLFLDEIGEMSVPLQAKVLRLLQEKEFQPVGATHTRTADVRFIAATHQDLRARVKDGTFREDLFFRLAVLLLHVPPLRERAGDVRVLARAFFAREREKHGRGDWTLADDALDALGATPWPGNVRELRNAIERIVILAEGPTITARDVAEIVEGAPDVVSTDLKSRVRDAERNALVEALAASNDNRTQAARLLGISRRTLYNKLEEHGLT